MINNEVQIEHFGIDFGTTNIAVGGLIVDKETKRAFRVLYGEDGVPFPSIVAVKYDFEKGKPVGRFGRKVKTQISSMQDEGYQIIKSIKTALGDEAAIYEIGPEKLSSTKVVTVLIKAIKRHLQTQLQRKVEIKNATVAVPVDFSNKQREELCKAFEKAGIHINKIVSESMAAYIRNRESVNALSNVMVFDWGGGTLDISLLKVEKGKVYEEATSGWKVAGDKIDETIAEFVHNQFVKNYNLTIAFKDLSIKDKTKLLTECEKAKITFSDEDEIDDPAIISMFDYCGEKKVFYKLEYEDFSAKIGGIVSEAILSIGKVLSKANMGLIDLDAIIIVGGSSNLLPLRNVMLEEFEKKHNIKIVYPDKPQWSVAEGAAVIDSVECQYEINQDISVVMSDGSIYPIIPKGSKIPFAGEPITFGTVDNATSANFIIADDKDNILDRLTMPAKGFMGEYFEVSGKIDNNLIAMISITGNKMMEKVGEKQTEINQLSYYCDISEIEDFKFEIKE
ncbi:MAG: Hsp70 family protein [Clostridia bacterium]|nr:Hsp70 family protein [Clostridia bacterium]